MMPTLLFARSGCARKQAQSKQEKRKQVQAHGCVLFETDSLAKGSLWRFLYSDISTSDPLSNLYEHKICFWLVSWPKSVPKSRFCSRSSWVIRSCLVRCSCSFCYPQHLFPVCRECQLVSIFINIRDADDRGTTKGFRASRSSVLLKYWFFAQFYSHSFKRAL